ncbi:MAG: TonB-dependent receptor [Gammaproteobacteria bacterium]|nr:TonB-dependent receptor [Gammaproteobacteria bacterium]MDH5303716.1 TonB-dependent receptor [Gammaproteobacteria bacterium]MDH5322702.1 TonB-dependent receptor [Gammaproteobacteria bacterium]
MRNYFALLFTSLLMPFHGAIAQQQIAPVEESDQAVEEIVVTGSAIKRVDLDSSLPIQVITADQFDREGITNAGDLIENIPAMQGFTTESDSVGGSGGGIRTANLRAIGSQYTLSLLDGRRMAPADSGSSIDLSNIPLAAVEQVQVLTDGASALYGSDAIAGVVNFILKDSVEETTVNVRSDRPSQSGGEHWNFDLVTGFGDLEDKGYSVVLSYSHEDQEQLAASDRDFAKSGFLFFRHEGQDLYFQNSSSNAVPGNAYVYTANYDSLIRNFNPNALANGGVCAEQTTPDGETCRFDYTSTLEVMPESVRDSLTLNSKFRLTDNLQGFVTALASNYDMIARIAPYPTGEIPLPLNSSLVVNEVLPYLTPAELAQVGVVTGTWRAAPAGNRTTEYQIDSMNLSFGLEGNTGDVDYSTAVTLATNQIDQNYLTGWLLLDEFVDAATSGSFNIFASQDEFTEADMAALEPTIYHGNWDVTSNEMLAVDAKASKPLFELAGGEVILAGGIDYRTTNYDRSISEANENERLLFLSKDTPYELERDQYGVFAEMLFPFSSNFETTVSLRYDDISAVSDQLNGGDIDSGDSDTTYKISGLWNVSEAVALRASYGTGFKAPSMREIGEPLSEFGVTSGTFDCPFTAPDPLAQYCKPTEDQYDVYRQGYGGLTFETSTQYTFGTVITPTDNFSMTVDYWNIQLEDLVERLTEQQIFDNAEIYRDLFTTKTNLATGQEFLAIIQAAVNVGTRDQSGVDYALNQGFDLGWGQLDLGLQGTYVMESESSLTGSSLGRFGNDDGVVFRNVINLLVTLYHGDFTHTLFSNYRSGYLDQAQVVEVLGTGVPLGQGPNIEVQLDVPSYMTTDYNLRYMMLDDKLGLSFGVSNLLDEEPPLSLRVSGAGHQLGWDPRYTDAFGRTYYLQAKYAF